MSILVLSSSGKLHETALSMEIGTKSTLNMHQVDELDPRIGTMLKLYRHHRGGTTYVLKVPYRATMAP